MQDQEINSSLMSHKLLTIEQTIENLDYLLAELPDLSTEIDQDQKNKLAKNISELINISQQLKDEISDCKHLEINLREEYNLQRNISVTQLQQEIIQHQYTEAALRESEEKFHQVVENIEQVFWMTNIYLNHIDYISPAYEKVWGRSCQSLYEHPKSWFEAILPEDRAIVISKREQQITGESVDIEYRITHTDGSIHWIWDRGFVVKNEQGEVCRLGGIAADITARKEAEEASQRARERLQAVLYAVPGFVAWFSEDLKYQGVNGHLATTFGLNPEDFAGKYIGFQNKVTDFSQFIHQFMASSELTATQILNTQINGYTRNYLTVIQKYQQGKAAVSVGIDITERQQAETQIKTSLKEKEVLLKEIHHRVKNNLQIVSSLLKLQSKYIKDEVIMALFNESHNRIRSMALIHEKLYQSQNLVQINVYEYIPELVNNLFRSYNIYTSRISLKLEIDDIYLDIDTAIPCGLIINELISNCLKYAFQVSLNGEIAIKYQLLNNNYVLIEVTDNGIGLPENFSIENSASLGLKLVSNLTDQINGKLEVNSEVNQGTTFKIIFKK